MRAADVPLSVSYVSLTVVIGRHQRLSFSVVCVCVHTANVLKTAPEQSLCEDECVLDAMATFPPQGNTQQRNFHQAISASDLTMSRLPRNLRSANNSKDAKEMTLQGCRQ